uniref:Uncharacterized protein n=1 Tax=Leersia perrieri TaxID=77586 RepID=A0A0D9W0J9_9ORYZ
MHCNYSFVLISLYNHTNITHTSYKFITSFLFILGLGQIICLNAACPLSTQQHTPWLANMYIPNSF